jgi:phosphodiesterase/alkaline phosphatase D-like protein
VYHYAVEHDGRVLEGSQGRFRTFPSGAADFTFAFGACAATGSNHPVFEHIEKQSPLFFLHVGDFHYEDIAVNDPQVFRAAIHRVLASPRQGSLYRSTAFAYMWDDHDYGPNDSDRRAPGRTASRRVYQEYVPHYPLAFDGGDVPIDQTFVVGRARFILSDLRSERDPRDMADGPDKRMMTEAQLAWLKREILAARAAGQMIFWVSSVPWIDSSRPTGDAWGGFGRQRRELANFLAEHKVDNMVILSGDAHMLAADDGTNANFSDDPAAPPIRVLQAGALDRRGSRKGGPYSEGMFPNVDGLGQYGHVTVADRGPSMHITFSGRGINAQGEMIERVSLAFTVPMPEK